MSHYPELKLVYEEVWDPKKDTDLPPANPDGVTGDSSVDRHEFENFCKQCELLLAVLAKEVRGRAPQSRKAFVKKLTIYRGGLIYESTSTIRNSSTPAPTVAASSPSASSGLPGPPMEDFKTALMTRLRSANEIGFAFLYGLERDKSPLIIQLRHMQFTLLVSDRVFEYSHIEKDGCLESSDEEKDGTIDSSDEEEDEQNEEDASHTSIDSRLPYWRIRHKSKGYFVVPKTQQNEAETAVSASSADKHDKAWVNDPNAGDIFLALGWLVNKQTGRQQRITQIRLRVEPFH